MDEVKLHFMVSCSKSVLGGKFVCSYEQISKTEMFHVVYLTETLNNFLKNSLSVVQLSFVLSLNTASIG